MSAPFILPSSAWAAKDKLGPNDKISLGFIGVGKQGGGLLNGFLHKDNVQVVAVCDVDGKRRAHAKKQVDDFYAAQKEKAEYKGCAAYNDFRDLLERADIDAVVIATPDHWHAINVIQAADAGKDIYCEKPLSLTIYEGRAMVNAVRRNARICQTGSQQRSSSNFRRACELVRSGYIGKIQTVEVAVGGPSKWCDLEERTAPPELDWDMWLGPAPLRGWNKILSPEGVHDHFPKWRRYREYSGGGMTDWGAHHFDIAQWGLGMDHTGPIEVIPPGGKDREHLTYRYANGIEMHHIDGNGVTFKGEDGEIFVNRGKFRAKPSAITKDSLGPHDVRLYESNDHRGNWLDCIRSREKPICDVEIGARSATVCHLGNLAYWYNRRLRWDPDRERFIDDAEANLRWLDVCRRPPWHV